MAPKTFTVLFVCSGNTCRSPMAAALMRAALRSRRPSGGAIAVRVRSAGLAAEPGGRLSAEAGSALKRLGVVPARHLAREVGDRTIAGADLVLTMTDVHRERILARWPEARARTFLISEFSGSGRGDVPDPIGGSAKVYDACARRLEEETRRIVPRLGRLTARRPSR